MKPRAGKIRQEKKDLWATLKFPIGGFSGSERSDFRNMCMSRTQHLNLKFIISFSLVNQNSEEKIAVCSAQGKIIVPVVISILI